MLKTPLSHARIAQLVQEVVVSAAIPGFNPAAASLFGRGPDHTADRDFPCIHTRESFGKKLKSLCIKAFEAQSPHGASR